MEDSTQQRSHSSLASQQLTKTGWLHQQSHSLLGTYKKRYLSLENKQLSIFESPAKFILKAAINFEQVVGKLIINPKQPTKFTLGFHGTSIVFRFRGSAEEVFDWQSCLAQAIKSSHPEDQGSVFKLTSCFYRYIYITEPEFSRMAEVGDIILFKGKSKICGAIRGVLKCDFDHIAVVYVLNGYIYLFESARSTGVVLTSWDEFVNRKWHELYSRIAYRKLMIERNERFFKLAHEFVAESEGKPYKLLKMNKNNSEGYFCSELVAEFYRKTGVVYQNTPANKFWPKNFVVAGGINIIQGDLGLIQDIKF
jgi:hypothetical protein